MAINPEAADPIKVVLYGTTIAGEILPILIDEDGAVIVTNVA